MIQVGYQVAKLQVVGAKVVTPLGDTMGLVDGDQRTVEISGEAPKAGKRQPLRRHVHDRVGAPGERSHPSADFVRGQRRSEECGRDAPARERGDLILHE
jgi:hypothetical protein